MSSAIDTVESPVGRVWRLVPQGQWLYAILDAACEPAIVDKLCALRPEFDSLYRGRAEQTLWEVAPYLVRLEQDSEFCRWLFDEGWGKAWGVFAIATADLTQLHRHFRRFLTVKGPKGEKLYFRYYDPRVLRDYLPTCNLREMATIFGPISSYLVEDKDPAQVMRFSPGRDGVKSEPLGLATIAQSTPDTDPAAQLETFLSPSSRGGDNIAPSDDDSPQAGSLAGAGRRTGRIQQVIIEIPQSQGTARKAWLRPGQSLSIGRTDDADFIVPHDEFLSGAHFELACDFNACRLRSLSTKSGTYVNGQRVTEVNVRDRDEIVAGKTTFSIQIQTDRPASTVGGNGGSLTKVGAAKGMLAAPAPDAPAVVRASIEVTAGPYDGMTADLPTGKPLVIGRLAGQGLALPNDQSISRRHCQIELVGSDCHLQDVGSSFGTYVKGEKVAEASLNNGDMFKAGLTEFRVHIGTVPAPVGTLRIRKEQMDTLGQPKRQDFKKRLMSHLNEVLPPKGVKIAPDALSQQIDEAILRSKHYRVYRECDVAVYVEIVVSRLGGFTADPHPREARNILYDHRLGPEEKLAKLRQWAEAAQPNNPRETTKAPGDNP
jgi:pSer/pThr/pTyr-binding forkhead associated (FHA) protein